MPSEPVSPLAPKVTSGALVVPPPNKSIPMLFAATAPKELSKVGVGSKLIACVNPSKVHWTIVDGRRVPLMLMLSKRQLPEVLFKAVPAPLTHEAPVDALTILTAKFVLFAAAGSVMVAVKLLNHC